MIPYISALCIEPFLLRIIFYSIYKDYKYVFNVNPNRPDRYKILLRKCIKCDCVITGTPICPPKRLACRVTGLLCERSADRNPG